MKEVLRNRIAENNTQLVYLTQNLEEIVKILKDKGVVDEEEEQAIHTYKATRLYCILSEKEDEAYPVLLQALKSTGNEELVKILEDQEEEEDNPPSPTNTVEAEVESHPHPHPQQPDQEGIALASEIEEELDRIQAQDDNEEEPEVTGEEGVKEVAEQLVQEIVEKVEDIDIDIQNNENGREEPEEEQEPPPQEEAEPEAVKEPEEPVINDNNNSSPREKKVSFEQRDFIIKSSEPEPEIETNKEDLQIGDTNSIVAMNKKLFEQNGGDGEGPKVKFSIGKRGATSPAPIIPKEEEPKESTVKNLRNFFQKLGSVDAESGSVTKRGPGLRNGGNPNNRRTMI